MVRSGTLLMLTSTVAALAGCSGGHGAASPPAWARQPGVYEVRVVSALTHPHPHIEAGPPQQIWIDTATGRFRIVSEPVRQMHGIRIVADFDGTSGTRVYPGHGPQLERYDGSPRFIVNQIGGEALRTARAFLAGSPPPRGVSLRIVTAGPPAHLVATTGLQRLRITIERVPPATASFAALTGHLVQTVRQLRPGERPPAAIRAYWLGPSWRGSAPRSSSASVGQVSQYTIGYPHLDIEVDQSLGGVGGGPVTLADGTHGTIDVARIAPDGSVDFGDSSSFMVIESASDGLPHGSLAVVSVSGATIILSGSAVNAASAAAIARALRPL